MRKDKMQKRQKNQWFPENKKMRNYVKWVGNAVCVLSILFVLSALFRIDYDAMMVTDWFLLLPVCVAGVLLKTVTVFLSGSAWCRWLEFFSGKRCDRREALRVYAKANIGKYLPGNVMHYVERNLFAGKLELSQKQIAAASLLEVFSLAAAAASIGMLFAFPKMQEAVAAVLKLRLFSDGSMQKVYHAMETGTAQFAVVCAGAAVICIMLIFRKRRKKRPDAVSATNSRRIQLIRTFLGSFFLYAAVLGILGLILAFLYWFWAGKPKLGFQKTALMTAAYSIAWVLGFLVPGAPGGIGVREMALTVMLSSAVGRDAIIAVSVLHRMVTVAGDFLAYLVRRFDLQKEIILRK